MVHLAIHMHTKNLLKIWLTIKILDKNAFYVLSPKDETLPNNHLNFL